MSRTFPFPHPNPLPNTRNALGERGHGGNAHPGSDAPLGLIRKQRLSASQSSNLEPAAEAAG